MIIVTKAGDSLFRPAGNVIASPSFPDSICQPVGRNRASFLLLLCGCGGRQASFFAGYQGACMSIDADPSAPANVLAATLYMMTLYQRSHCPRLALSIAAHLDCLSRHPGVDELVRSVADGMHDEWHVVARGGFAPQRPMVVN